ncbi:sigma-70 family RNA polymerase sigma factor [Achromobacter pulmonis]|nr:sigma-70 family RNA polymerase sigma factor [Achromobacter pulmonis]MCF7766525.1 sigma-70 family RNA polymerase sigma factor [Achromobacter pulmonis]
MQAPSNPAAADPNLVASMYREHHAWLFAFMRRQTGGHPADAWDLVQDTFERLLRQTYLESRGWNRGYLATIARRLLIDRHRRRELETAYLAALAQQPEPLSPSPEMLAQVSQQLLAVCAVLDRMPRRMREVFLLARLQGLSYEAIASRLHITVNVVQKDMVQGWQRLYHALDV